MKQLQIHIIVIVNEYGCTEGIVTIEDILEEIVGNISDEHDIDEERLYAPTNDNAWIVDAKMNIIDLEAETGISIPPDPEYETVGGFILYEINSFPSVGAIIHTDNFDIKVLSTGKRQIYKVKIIPTNHSRE
jgi:CBS domain containing-hemolysin-like protein